MQMQSFNVLNMLNTYITPEGKLNIFGGKKEGFDANILPDDTYKGAILELQLTNIEDVKQFVRNLDTPIKYMTVDLLTNRIQILTKIKDLWNKQDIKEVKKQAQENEPNNLALKQPTLRDIYINNIDYLFTFINRIIDLVILHSIELQNQLKSGGPGGSVEFFTITPITLNMPDQEKNVFNKFVSKYGLTFDDVVEFINNAELPAQKLNSKGKILRLRVLSLFRQILSITVSSDLVLKSYLLSTQPNAIAITDATAITDTTAQVASLVHNVVSYIIDLHIKELYDNMTRDEIKIGNYFEKFIRYYPIENDVVNKELSRTRITLTDLQTQMDSLKAKFKEDFDKATADANKRATDATADATANIKAETEVVQTGLIGGIILTFILCLIMTVMYFRK